jgi:hypothetical protein
MFLQILALTYHLISKMLKESLLLPKLLQEQWAKVQQMHQMKHC